MAFITSPNMGLPIPVTGSEPGPAYANDVNNSLTLIDQHNHTPGSGVQLTQASINVNGTFPFNNFPITGVQALTLVNQGSGTPTTASTLYSSNGTEPTPRPDLWYYDGFTAVQITSGGQVNATAAAIPGESYAGGTFSWRQGTGSTTPANFDIGSVTVRPNSAGTTNGVTLSPSSSLSGSLTLFLPFTLPSVNSLMTLDNGGNINTTSPYALNPVGAVIMFTSSSAPTGYLNCDGSSYSTSTYAALFAVIGYTYGGSGSSFNVPNFQGLFPRSIGTQGGYTGPIIGSTQGQSTAVNGLSASSPPHSHTLTQFTNANTGTSLSNSAANLNPSTLTTSSVSVSVSLSGDAETRPGNFGINFCIKT